MENLAIDLSQLSSAQLEALTKQVKEKEAAEKERIQNERNNYKKMVDEAVMACLPILRSASEQLSLAKEFCLDEFKALLHLKTELYGVKSEQQSHTFTNSDGSISIILGYHYIDGWDDTVSSGIAIVEQELDNLVHDETSRALIKGMRKLMAKDGTGNIQYKRLGKIKEMAEELKIMRLQDGLKIIEQAYRPKRSTDYIKCLVLDEKGKKISLALSISDAPLPEKETTEEDTKKHS
jgi:hypothetical protein